MTKLLFLFVFLLGLCNIADSNIFKPSTWFSKISRPFSSFYCSSFECCDDKQVPYNIKSLGDNLKTKIYGQHIAVDIVLNAINSHLENSKPNKPLVMSFHGPNGVGKSYISRIIANAFYEQGENSAFFHFYYGLENFPMINKISEYQTQLKSEIEHAISRCERSLFVFDGVDQMPPDLLNVLMPFIDCPNCSGKHRKNKSIFIFLTNTGSLAIQQELLAKIDSGVRRELTSSRDFEGLVVAEALKMKGGLFESLMIEKDAIDFYVPFLPMDRKCVRQCIVEAIVEVNGTASEEMVEQVFSELTFEPKPSNLFSRSGCKRVAQIAGRIVARTRSLFGEEELSKKRDEF